ncbi:MAG: decaprenyl-phosphate phosphoribosyltransferase [Candidatus Aureabacteria bacterium]|nr:decaprenyl-phosphate phosphoribosyltransferase [Candidatus Auribacterota bacterium]
MMLILEAMRPRQWIKNFIIFAGILFSNRFFQLHDLLIVCGAFIIFCALSSAEYLINDVADFEEDKRHNLKRMRPIASGKLSCPTAIVAAVILAFLSLFAAFCIGVWFGVTALGYFILILAYSFVLKHVVIIDVLVIAFGFVLRAVAGGLAIGVAISPWLLICTILLALFLGLSKRRHELVLLVDDARHHRPILEEYSTYLLDQMIAVVTSSTLMAYVLYTLSPRTQKEVSDKLYLTVPFVLYGIFRYLWLVHHKDEGGSPEKSLISDKPLLIDVVLWALCGGLILWYSHR